MAKKQQTIKPLQKPVVKTVSIPGSKSYTNRALIMAAVSIHPVKIFNPLISDDITAMVNCLNTLGIRTQIREDHIEVIGSIRDIKNQEYDLDADLSGTTIRFLLALICLVPGIKVLRGKDGLNKRPIKHLVDALKQLGAKIEYVNQEGFPPLKISSSKLTQKECTVNGTVSSQFISALLMVSPLMNGLTIHIDGEQISKSYIDMTIDGMKQFGVTVKNNKYKSYSVKPNQNYSVKEYTVEGDYSGAGYFAALAALTKSTITLTNLNPNSKQGDREFLKILESMGNIIKPMKNGVKIIGKGIKPITVDMENCPDQAQTLAVLCAFTDGKSTLSGIRSLRVKETERVKAVETELKKMAIETSSTPNELVIHGGNPKPAEIDTYGDHRMAMSFAIAGTKQKGMKINNPEVVSKTFPDFWNRLKEIGV